MSFVLPPEAASLREKSHAPGGRAYLCRGMQCSAPAATPAQLVPLLPR